MKLLKKDFSLIEPYIQRLFCLFDKDGLLIGDDDGSAHLKCRDTVNIHVRRDGDDITVEFIGTKPYIEIKMWLLRDCRADISKINIKKNSVHIVLDGLPDLYFEK